MAINKNKLYNQGIFEPHTFDIGLDQLFARVIQPAVNFDAVPLGGYVWFLTKKPPVRSSPPDPPYTAGKIVYRRMVWGGDGIPSWLDTAWQPLSESSYLDYFDLGERENQAYAPNLGEGTLPLETFRNGSGVYTAIIRNGILWICQAVGLDGPEGSHGRSGVASSVDRTGVQWLKLQLNSIGTPLTLLDHGRIFDDCPSDPYYYIFPSMMVNSIGDMVVGFSACKATSYIGAFYAWRLADGSTRMKPARIKEGLDAFGDSRWGDYSYTSLDPADGLTFWTVQEYAETGGFFWGTWIAKIRRVP